MFDKSKQIVTHDNLLLYPDFNEGFDIHKDSSNFQSGAVIIKNGKPIALYCRKHTPAQWRYTVTQE